MREGGLDDWRTGGSSCGRDSNAFFLAPVVCGGHLFDIGCSIGESAGCRGGLPSTITCRRASYPLLIADGIITRRGCDGVTWADGGSDRGTDRERWPRWVESFCLVLLQSTRQKKVASTPTLRAFPPPSSPCLHPPASAVAGIAVPLLIAKWQPFTDSVQKKKKKP